MGKKGTVGSAKAPHGVCSLAEASYPSEVLTSKSFDLLVAHATGLTPPTANADPITLARTTTTISFAVRIIYILVVHMES